MSTNAQEMSNDRGALDKSHMTTALTLDQRAAGLCAAVQRHADESGEIQVEIFLPRKRRYLRLGDRASQFDSPEKCLRLLTPLRDRGDI